MKSETYKAIGVGLLACEARIAMTSDDRARSRAHNEYRPDRLRFAEWAPSEAGRKIADPIAAYMGIDTDTLLTWDEPCTPLPAVVKAFDLLGWSDAAPATWTTIYRQDRQHPWYSTIAPVHGSPFAEGHTQVKRDGAVITPRHRLDGLKMLTRYLSRSSLREHVANATDMLAVEKSFGGFAQESDEVRARAGMRWEHVNVLCRSSLVEESVRALGAYDEVLGEYSRSYCALPKRALALLIRVHDLYDAAPTFEHRHHPAHAVRWDYERTGVQAYEAQRLATEAAIHYYDRYTQEGL